MWDIITNGTRWKSEDETVTRLENGRGVPRRRFDDAPRMTLEDTLRTTWRYMTWCG